MYSLQLIVGPGVGWNFLFRSKENAESAVASLDNEQIHFTDDFGSTGILNRTELKGAFLEDMENSRAAQLERVLHEQRTKAKAQQLMAADPTLRLAGQSGGPPVMMPMGPNGRF